MIISDEEQKENEIRKKNGQNIFCDWNSSIIWKAVKNLNPRLKL